MYLKLSIFYNKCLKVLSDYCIVIKFDEKIIKMEIKNSYELCKEADALLASQKLSIWGNERTRDKYLQSRFEDKMQNGAYNNNSERGGRGK